MADWLLGPRRTHIGDRLGPVSTSPAMAKAIKLVALSEGSEGREGTRMLARQLRRKFA